MVDNRLKLAYIGAGSHRFSIGLFKNIVYAKELHPMDIYLVDIDEKIVDWTTRLLKHMVEKAGVDVNVFGTIDRREALEGADFVYKSISVGGQKAEWFDNYIPAKFGIIQNTGDTCGPGGFFRSLRVAYVVDKIAKDMKELCPNAVLLNYTNPQAQLVMAARNVHPDLQFIGLCHELFGGMRAVQKLMTDLGHPTEKWEDFDIRYGGINHFAWLTELRLNGEDLYPLLREKAEYAYKNKIGDRPFNYYLLMKYNWFPYPGSRHVAEFMPEYFNYFNHKKAFGIVQIRNVYALAQSHKMAIQKFKVMAQDFYKPYVPLPSASGEKAMEMTNDWRNNIPNHHVVNIPNNGLISNLPDDAIIEVPGYFKDGKVHGVSIGKLPNKVADLVRPFVETHKLAAKAAIKGNRDSIIEALTKWDPMAKFIEDDEKIEHMVDLMLYYQREWLPAFEEAETIPKWDQLKDRKYVVTKQDLIPYEQAIKVKYSPDERLKSKAIFVEGGQTPKDVGDIL